MTSPCFLTFISAFFMLGIQNCESCFPESNIRVYNDQICICTKNPGLYNNLKYQISPPFSVSSQEVSEPTSHRLRRVGNQDKEIKSRIVGGDKLSISEAPYQVSLQLYGRHFCGGSVITRLHVITAAHCVYRKDARSLSIRAGSTYHDHGGVVVNVAAVLAHPNYNPATTDYDVAVLKLAQPLAFSEAIKPIELVTTVDWSPGTPGLATGWGSLSEGSEETPQNLMGVVLYTQNFQYCRKMYSWEFTLTDRMLCVGGTPSGGKDSCQGDSGGPFIIGNKLAGIVSWGFGCGRPSIPALYTNVAKVRNFIDIAVRY